MNQPEWHSPFSPPTMSTRTDAVGQRLQDDKDTAEEVVFGGVPEGILLLIGVQRMPFGPGLIHLLHQVSVGPSVRRMRKGFCCVVLC